VIPEDVTEGIEISLHTRGRFATHMHGCARCQALFRAAQEALSGSIAEHAGLAGEPGERVVTTKSKRGTDVSFREERL
jgi:hypothetical protein